jgi:hypothetical protein
MRTHYAGKMTRTHATKLLLAEQPMRLGEIVEVSGWTPKVTFLVLTRLMHRGDVIPVNRNGKRHYALTFWKPAASGMPMTESKQTGHSTGMQSFYRG